ncbi:hypothetical protein A2585_00580 [Candidatus Nomurabacteria bacterium RIFOXYD1_FULL_39_12]|nr:MAG: hypothetical protein A2585_00580 [Candidatus Nomurabacteria bacterium RIFOXYD1_FULL_39_12]
MWILEREFTKEPDRKNILIRKWLSYITLFIAGATLAGDLVMVLYYFIDGQALTTGFLLKVLSVLVVSVCVFLYYISDIRDRLTSFSRKIWRVVAFVIVAGSIVWGFSVLGSPHTQRLLKYDEQKINDLMNINSQVTMHYELKGFLPTALSDLISLNNYSFMPVDQQTGKAYEYKLLGQSARAYELCAEFNKASNDKGNQTTAMKYPYGDVSWTHGSGRYCFERAVDTNMYPKSAR